MDNDNLIKIRSIKRHNKRSNFNKNLFRKKKRKTTLKKEKIKMPMGRIIHLRKSSWV